MFKRVIIKLSGEALAGNKKNFDDTIINEILMDIKECINNNVEVSIVIGGGNFWRGRSADSNMDRTIADEIGMLATCMNGLYVADYFKRNGCYAKVFTPFTVGTFTTEFSKEEALKVMKNKGVNIFVGGVGHPFFSTDTITALRAAELDCDCILYAKNIDGIYNKDPNKYEDAKKYDIITYSEIIKNNLQAIDISAMNLSMSQNINSLVFKLGTKSSIFNAVLEKSENCTKITN
ncbi:MAG: uridine monophosphate kinase [Lachnospirales bacterium]